LKQYIVYGVPNDMTYASCLSSIMTMAI